MVDDGKSVRISIGTPLPGIIKRGSTSETTVSITDDDVPGVTVTPTELSQYWGGTSTYTVALDSQPTADVTVEAPSSVGDINVSPAKLTFTTQNWSAPQEVSVKSDVSDDDFENVQEVMYTIAHTVTGGDYSSE